MFAAPVTWCFKCCSFTLKHFVVVSEGWLGVLAQYYKHKRSIPENVQTCWSLISGRGHSAQNKHQHILFYSWERLQTSNVLPQSRHLQGGGEDFIMNLINWTCFFKWDLGTIMKCTSFVNVLSPVHFWSTKHVSAIFTLNYTTAVKGISSKLPTFPFLLPPCVQALSEQKNVFVIIFSLFSCVRTSVIVKKIIKSTFILVKCAWIQH